MSHKKFTKDIWIIGITNLIIALRGLILLPIITKILGENNYGIWVQIIAALPLIALLATLGLPYTLVRFLAGQKNAKALQDGFYSVATISLTMAAAILAMVWLFSYQLAGFLQWPNSVVKIFAAIILFECLNFVSLHLFRTLQKISLYSFFMIFQTLGEIILTAAAVWLGYGFLGAVTSLLIVRIVTFLATGLLVLLQIGFAKPLFLNTKEYLAFGLPTIPGNISNWCVGFLDRYLIGFFLGLTFVAYYGPAGTLGGIMSFLSAPFSFLLPAAISKLHNENNISEVKKYLRYSLKYFLALAIPAFFGLSLLAKELLQILSTESIAENGYLLVPLLALGMLIYGAYGVIYLILILFKKTMLVGNIWIAGALINLGLNYFFIPRFGITAAAITNLLTYAIILALTWYYSKQYLTFKIDWSFIAKSALASLVMSLGILLYSPTGIFQIFIAIIFSVIVYSIGLIILKSFSKNEVAFFRSFLKT